jgi:Na+/melibiose symporter-like transporter
VPAVTAIAAAVVMLAYPLTEERLREMVQEMAQRRAAGTDKVEVRLGGGPRTSNGR